MSWQSWQHLGNLSPRQFVCGFCSDKVGAHMGYHNSHNGHLIYICPNCGAPTYFVGNIQHPGAIIGRSIKNLPEDVNEVYREIRESVQNACYTAAVLLGRKLLMHIAVDIAKAKEGNSFVSYIDHLSKSGYIPPHGGKWLTFVKDIGNEKNHELKIGEKDESEKILKFIEVLLIFIYEFPNELPDEEVATPTT
ncbi:MAG: DUF4145 domain-containing protein [Candidatus Levybacteria bacterium]|nr:DUF4145 domain-containing protein [Candidatus Levybacteria bacterium]